MDGYIAKEKGDVDWLHEVEGENGFDEFYKTIDTVIMGKTTCNEKGNKYEMIIEFNLSLTLIIDESERNRSFL